MESLHLDRVISPNSWATSGSLHLDQCIVLLSYFSYEIVNDSGPIFGVIKNSFRSNF